MNAQARLGAFVLIGILLIGLLSVKIGRMHIGARDGMVVEAIFDDVAGLEEQTPVRLAGVRVGNVESISLDGNRALVRIRLKPNVVLPASTTARLVGGGLVGEKFLSLKAKPGDNTPLPEGQLIPAASGGGIESFVAQTERMADDFHEISQQSQVVLHDLSGILEENRATLKDTLDNLHGTSQTLSKDLGPTLDHLDQSLQNLPGAIDAGKRFFTHSDDAVQKVSALLDGNRENIYRAIFEIRKTAENLDALSDDLRRNPWKLTNKQPEVRPSPRATQEKMEELMLSTGRMGLAPARQ
jgi:phospholipid/cholesterol/gamma-HCH transport system substrate-binding protein